MVDDDQAVTGVRTGTSALSCRLCPLFASTARKQSVRLWPNLPQIPTLHERRVPGRQDRFRNGREQGGKGHHMASDIDRGRFRITPFPIETPDRLHEFVPRGCKCFTTLVNEWNDEKVRRLNEHGFPTTILGLSVPDNMRVTSGTEIRRLIRVSDPSWARFVPQAVAEAIEDRLRPRFA